MSALNDAMFAFGDLVRRDTALPRPVDDLVVDVGEVAHEAHLVAEEAQVAVDDVERDQGAGVADVRAVVDGDAAHVHADLAGNQRLERPRPAR